MASATFGQISTRLQQVRKVLLRGPPSQCWYTSQTGKEKESKPTATSSAPEKTQQKAEKFDNSTYKVPEYYSHNMWTFYDMEKTMAPSRVPQPSSLKQASK